MKLTILQQDLLPPLQAVSRSTGIRSTLPVLANILLQAGGGKLKLSATNLEVGVIKQFSAKTIEGGEISVPAKTLLEVISSLPQSEITLEASLDQLKISTPKFKATLNATLASEFPAIPTSSDHSFAVEAKVLKEVVPQIAFAAAADEGRPVLTGILTQIENGSLELVATDGFRLAHKRVSMVGKTASFKALIPRRTFEEVVRLIDEDIDGDDKLKISTSENQNQMIFEIGATIASSRLIEGHFPAWEKIIPSSFASRIILDKGEFLKAVKLASVFAKDSSSVVKIQADKDVLKIISESKELGGQETTIEAQVEGEQLTIAFNAKFLLDVLNAAPSTQIILELSGVLSPALLKPMGEEGLEYIIMPVRLS